MSLAPIWLTFDEENRPQDKWDSHGIRRTVADAAMKSDGRGGVVILAAGPNADATRDVNLFLEPLDWALLVLTADEGSLFPLHELSHRRMIVWQQTPPKVTVADRVFGYAPPNRAYDSVRTSSNRDLDWCFMGQVTHPRRQMAHAAMVDMQRGLLYPTKGFAQGFQPDSYYHVLSNSRVSVCPSGARTPDTFRVWESILLGCVPVVDELGPDGRAGYWDQVFPGSPLQRIVDWSTLPAVVDDVLSDWKRRQRDVCDWWFTYNGDLIASMRDDVERLQS
jgi:hypothetical protein